MGFEMTRKPFSGALFVLLLLVSQGILSNECPMARARASSETLTGAQNKDKLTYRISVAAVLHKIRTKQKIMLVDTRESSEFDKYRIPCSINLPLHVIKRKNYLKNNELVIIHKGYHYDILEKECEKLDKLGFKVWILNGGLSNWIRRNGPMEGDLNACLVSNRIPPIGFHTVKNREDWVLIGAFGAQKIPEYSILFSNTRIHIIDEINNNEQLVYNLKKILDKYKSCQFISLLIFDKNGNNYDNTVIIDHKLSFTNFYYLKGGFGAYQEFIKEQNAMNRPKKKRKKFIDKCMTCR
jgi:rhodanese-related sulfurtransferase